VRIGQHIDGTYPVLFENKYPENGHGLFSPGEDKLLDVSES
jgi:hypothetical protein